jgi:hypothetical protein
VAISLLCPDIPAAKIAKARSRVVVPRVLLINVEAENIDFVSNPVLSENSGFVGVVVRDCPLRYEFLVKEFFTELTSHIDGNEINVPWRVYPFFRRNFKLAFVIEPDGDLLRNAVSAGDKINELLKNRFAEFNQECRTDGNVVGVKKYCDGIEISLENFWHGDLFGRNCEAQDALAI